MINIEELKPQIIKALMPLNPDKIILFGSYAYGTPNDIITYTKKMHEKFIEMNSIFSRKILKDGVSNE